MTVQIWHYCSESQPNFKFWPMIFSQVSWIWCRIVTNSSHRLQVASAPWASCNKKEKLSVLHGACCCNAVVVRKFRILIFCQIRIYLTSDECLGVWLSSKSGSICIKSEALSYLETFCFAFWDTLHDRLGSLCMHGFLRFSQPEVIISSWKHQQLPMNALRILFHPRLVFPTAPKDSTYWRKNTPSAQNLSCKFGKIKEK